MAAEKGSEHVYSAARRSSSSITNTSATNESSLIVRPYFATPNAAASYPNAELPVYASSSLQPSLSRTHTGTGNRTPKSAFLGAAAEFGTDLHTSQNSPCISEELNCSSIHSCPRNHDACCFVSSKRSGNCATPLRIPVVAVDNEFGSMALLQTGYTTSNKHRSRAHEPKEKLHALFASSTEESSQEARKLDEGGPAGEIDQEEEEEGCTTPTARDQRIPQYGWEGSALRCPPAPKKKAGLLKRRRLFYSANMAVAACAGGHTANNVDSRLMRGERGALFVDPPADLQNFPDCIRALFK